LLDKVRDGYGVATEVYGMAALTATSLINVAGRYHRIDEGLLL
jgi:hypothetical protein